MQISKNLNFKIFGKIPINTDTEKHPFVSGRTKEMGGSEICRPTRRKGGGR